MDDFENSVRESTISKLIVEVQEKLDRIARHDVLCTALLTNSDGELIEIHGRKEQPLAIHHSNSSVH